MGLIAHLLQTGIPIRCTRPPIPVTPYKLLLNKEDLQTMIPKHYLRELEIEKRKEEKNSEISAVGMGMEKLEGRQIRPKFKARSVENQTIQKPCIISIKTSDRIHASLTEILSSGKVRDPLLLSSDLHICRVHMTPSRGKAIVQWSLLNTTDSSRVSAITESFEKHRKIISHLVGQQVQTKFHPYYLFEYTEDPFGKETDNQSDWDSK